MDNCPLIWKNFSANNYFTSFLEDEPHISIFNYEKAGFVEQPADYYLRPLMVAHYNHKLNIKKKSRNTKDNCLNGKTSTEFIAQYIKKFTSVVGSRGPYFLYSWFTGISHDNFNGLKASFSSLSSFSCSKPLFRFPN